MEALFWGVGCYFGKFRMKRNNLITCCGHSRWRGPMSNLAVRKEVYSISVPQECFLKSPNKKEMSLSCRSLPPIVSPSHATLPIQQPNEDSCSLGYKFCISKVEGRLNAVFAILWALVFRGQGKASGQDEIETWCELQVAECFQARIRSSCRRTVCVCVCVCVCLFVCVVLLWTCEGNREAGHLHLQR